MRVVSSLCLCLVLCMAFMEHLFVRGLQCLAHCRQFLWLTSVHSVLTLMLWVCWFGEMSCFVGLVHVVNNVIGLFADCVPVG